MADSPNTPDGGEKRKGLLSSIFRRKAKLPPIPEDILSNKRVQKEIFKRRRRKWRNRILGVLLASSALSTGLQFHPGLVSKPFNEYMAEQGYPGDLSQNFHAREIRVYERNNILYPFHLAGNETSIIWHEAEKDPHQNKTRLAIATPFIYTEGLIKGFGDMIFPNALDAYSMSNDDDPSLRQCFIRPPADFSLNRFFADFSRVDSKDFKFQHSDAALKKTLFEYVMLHEARHCDQEKTVYVNANESDADIYAFRVLQDRGTDPGLLQETKTIITHLRAMNAVLKGDDSHASTFAMMRGGESVFTAHEDAASFTELRALIGEAGKYNDNAFPSHMSDGQRSVYLAAALYNSHMLDNDPQVKQAAVAFINAIDYFNNASGGRIVNPTFDMNAIDLTPLFASYKPVPDKLSAPAPQKPAPLKPAPRRGFGS
ncbi:MAG: hypothetical protein GC185_06155 [Alphaproteobacteria bacterium]|nr:hypothetical protein [Alphaproteobacteria bacterium]